MLKRTSINAFKGQSSSLTPSCSWCFLLNANQAWNISEDKWPVETRCLYILSYFLRLIIEHLKIMESMTNQHIDFSNNSID